MRTHHHDTRSEQHPRSAGAASGSTSAARVTLPAGLLALAVGLGGCSSSDAITPSAHQSRPGPARAVVGELSAEAIETCRTVFDQPAEAGPAHVVIVWDNTASVADMPFPAELAADLHAASLAGGGS